ncbi:hypothetical protein IFM89_007523 [Coptis chinensis]|uniref:Uncharacterized protein n=1 Tax=Coptis chinensis TaxID=261450 RepID=A0A835LX11_9MAGN|nr:hypothetical protein IFM89_007523 [Coptis chinensis]
MSDDHRQKSDPTPGHHPHCNTLRTRQKNMAPHSRRESLAGSVSTFRSEFEYDTDLEYPFGKIEALDRDDLREAAYEIFFTACRSSPGFGGSKNTNINNALTYTQSEKDGGNETSSLGGNKERSIVGSSRVKRALGLKSVKRLSSMKKISSPNSNPSAPSVVNSPRIRRPLTSAEIMRQQMRVSELSDNRLRKTILRTLVGQMGRKAETIILPLELIRHLKPSEFSDAQEYHLWQNRQLKILEAGLVRYPSIPLDKSNPYAIRLREIVHGSEMKSIDTGKNSETMRTLCNCVISLSWRTANGTTADFCHWADGFPLNINLYVSLLCSVFDHKDETLVLDEIDELLELMKKTWSTLGINKVIHNACFTWLLFQQYVATVQSEQDLLCASLAMLSEVANDVTKSDREVIYMKILSSVLASIQDWSEKRLLHYRESFQRGTAGLMENLLPLALSAARILAEDISNISVVQENEELNMDTMGNRVDYYIKSSLRNAFAKILENAANSMDTGVEEEASETLLHLAKETEEIAIEEKENFSPILKKWHPIAAGVAAMTLHDCYGVVLKQYLSGVSTLTNEAIRVLQRAGKLEKDLIQIVVEDSVDCEDGGKAIIREMVPYEVESIILGLIKTWVDERLKRLRNCFDRAKETETWNPMSKTEPFAHSAVEIVKLARETVDHFFEIPITISDDLIQDLADALEHLFQDYTSFVATCGSKQSYIPPLPSLTRCNRDSRFLQLWKKTCKVGVEDNHRDGSTDVNHPRPSTSRGTQRLYVRLNTLHYILTHIHSLDKSLSLAPRQNSLPRSQISNSGRPFTTSTAYFNLAHSSILAATQNVSEVAAYRLIFLDSNFVFYNGLYTGDVANARIRPALRTLKQNLTFLSAILTDKAQPLAMKEVMKATFEAYLMVLLAGGSRRNFTRLDHDMIEEDFDSLKRVFCACGEGLIAEEVVEKEAETVEGVVTLMGQCTEQLVEDFSIVTCEVSGLGVIGSGQRLPMPPTTGRWNRADPNTILRVLCHRDDKAANHFLKKNFQLAKRR